MKATTVRAVDHTADGSSNEPRIAETRAPSTSSVRSARERSPEDVSRATYEEYKAACQRKAISSLTDILVHCPKLVENECIVDPSSTAAQQFHNYMSCLKDRLLAGTQWKPTGEIYFLLSKSDSPNAYVLAKDEPPLIVFTTGMLKFVRNTDELAFILGHELVHVKAAQHHKAVRTTKGEEAFADLEQIPWLYEVGFNPLAGANVMTRFWRNAVRSSHVVVIGAVVALLDEHVSDALRPNLITNRAQLLARGEGIADGFIDTKYQPKESLIETLPFTVQAYDYFEQLAEERGYHEMTPEQQLQFLHDGIDHVTDGFAPHARAEGLRELFEQCECSGYDPIHQALGQKIVTKLLDNPQAFTACYGTVVVNTLDVEETTPVGELVTVQDSITKLIEAKDKDSLREAARDLMNFLDSHPELKLSRLRWPAFSLPNPKDVLSIKNINGIPLPWNSHITLALQLAHDGDPSAQRALFRLGVEDKRLFEQMDYKALLEIQGGYKDDKFIGLKGDKQPPAGKHPLILSPPSGAGSLTCFALDFTRGVCTDVIWGPEARRLALAYVAKHTWAPAHYATRIINQARFERSQAALNNLTNNPLTETHPEWFKDNFTSWLEQNTDRLSFPDIFIPESNYPQGIAEPQQSMTFLEQEQIRSEYRAKILLSIAPILRPNHEQFVKYLNETLLRFKEEFKPQVRRFFLEKGPNTFEHIFAPDQDMYLKQWDKKRFEGADYLTAHRIPIDFPEVVFVLSDPHKLFSIGERASFIKTYSGFPKDPSFFERYFCPNRDQTESAAVENLRELEALLRESDTESIDVSTLVKAATPYAQKVLTANSAGGRQLLRLSQIAPKITQLALENDESRELASLPFIQDLQSMIRQFLHTSQEAPEDTLELTCRYRFSEIAGIIKDTRIYESLTQTLLAQLEREASTSVKLEAAEALLLDGEVINVLLRQKAIDVWCETIFENLRQSDVGLEGYDDDSVEYHKAVMSFVSRLQGRAPATLTATLVAKLADRLETQAALSHKLEQVASPDAKEVERRDRSLRVLEALTIALGSTRNAYFKLLDFLTVPLTDSSKDSFSKVLHELTAHGSYSNPEESWIHLFNIDSNERSKDYWRIKSAEIYQSFWQLPLVGRAAIMDQLLLPAAKRFFTDFSESEEEQELSLKGDYRAQHLRVMASVHSERAFSYVINKCIPGGIRYADQAREFLQLYSEELPPLQKPMLFAVLLSVERASEGRTEKDFGVGKRLAMILDMMGPAERKVGQGINSHPSIPDDLRYDARELKFKASPLLRWDAWYAINHRIPSEYRPTIKRLGKPLGSASFYVNYGIERTDGSRGALRLLRDNALPQALEGLRLLERLRERYEQTHPDSREMCEVMADLFAQAKAMAFQETNSTVGCAQMQYARKLYDGYAITVDDHTFRFSNAHWRAYGKGFMDQEFQPGVHFLELPEHDAVPLRASALSYKRAAAKAYVTMEFINILSGSAFDHDRHGAQLRIIKLNDSESLVGLFDNGAIHVEVKKADGSLAQPHIDGRSKTDDLHTVLEQGGRVVVPPPTAEEKTLLVRTLIVAISDYLDPSKRRPVADTLYDQVRRIRAETGSTPEYLLRVQRALLSLNDFFGFRSGVSASPSPETRVQATAPYITDTDLADILTGIIQARNESGQSLVDPEIEKALTGGFMGRVKSVFSALQSRLLGGSQSPKQELLKVLQSTNPVIVDRAVPPEKPLPRVFD